MSRIKTELNFNDFPFICRICLYKGDTKPFTQALQNIFSTFTYIAIEEEDELPKNICSNCVSRLEDFKVFIDLAVFNGEHLKDVLLQHKHKLSLEYFDNDTKFEISEEEITIEENYADDDTRLSDINDEDSDENIQFKLEENEQIEKHQFHCKICKNVFISLKDLKEHRKQNKDCAFKCETCSESFESSKKLHSHKIENESCKVEQHKCKICGKVFKKRSFLKKHGGVHSNDTPFECKLCDKKFKFSQNLRRHDNIVHKGVKPFKCDVCGKDFGQYVTLKTHILNMHGLNVSNCEYRGMKYRTLLASLKDLESNLTQINRNIKQKKHSPVKCEVCSQNFQNIYTLNAHKIVHTDKKDFLCNICGKKFVRKLNLVQHSRIHTGEKPYECEHCGKQFSQATGYNRHLVIHTGERPYVCEFCDKSFKQAAHLNSHIKGHTNDKSFECNFCGKAFSFKRSWEVHVRIHTGERPYFCIYCDKRFYDKSSLSKHKKIHLRSEIVKNVKLK